MGYFDNIYNKLCSSIFFQVFKFFIDIFILFWDKLKHIIALLLAIVVLYLLFGNKFQSVHAATFSYQTELTGSYANTYNSWATNNSSIIADSNFDIIVSYSGFGDTPRWSVWYYDYVSAKGLGVDRIRLNNLFVNDNSNVFRFRNSSNQNVGATCYRNNNSTIYTDGVCFTTKYTDINFFDFYIVRCHFPIFDSEGGLIREADDILPSFRNANQVLDLEHSYGDHLYIDMNSVQYAYSLQVPPFYSQTNLDLVARINGTDYHVPLLEDWIFIDPRAFPDSPDYDPNITDNMWVITVPKYWLFQNGYIDNTTTIQLFFSWNNENLNQIGTIQTNNFSYLTLSADKINDINSRIGSTFQAVQTRMQEIANRQREWEENENDKNMLSWFAGIKQTFTNGPIFLPVSGTLNFIQDQFTNWNYNTARRSRIVINLPFTNSNISLVAKNILPNNSLDIENDNGDLWFIRYFYWFVISGYILCDIFVMWGKIHNGEIFKIVSPNLYSTIFK